MKVYHGINEIPAITRPVLTIGTFDGVHLGHKKIISKLNKLAEEADGESVLMTFHPHPRSVINPDANIAMLSSLEEKLSLLEMAGVGHSIVVPFNREFSEISAESYVRDFLIGNLHPHTVVIGYDHRFGLDRRGDINLLTKIANDEGAQVVEIKKQTIDELAISSTRIREALLDGKVELAAQLLGYHYEISGIVVKGFQVGRELGYPTANLLVNDPNKLIPGDGIYAIRASLGDEKLNGMLSIGYRPTFEGKQRTIEAHLFDFDRDIYGEKMSIAFVSYIRSEKKFDSRQDLIKAMENDQSESYRLLGLD